MQLWAYIQELMITQKYSCEEGINSVQPNRSVSHRPKKPRRYILVVFLFSDQWYQFLSPQEGKNTNKQTKIYMIVMTTHVSA